MSSFPYNLFVDTELFNIFETRTKNTPTEAIDVGIRNHIQILNNIDGITTVWCCSGLTARSRRKIE